MGLAVCRLFSVWPRGPWSSLDPRSWISRQMWDHNQKSWTKLMSVVLHYRLVREELCELEIPHIYHTVARNSPKRKELENKWQTFQVNGCPRLGGWKWSALNWSEVNWPQPGLWDCFSTSPGQFYVENFEIWGFSTDRNFWILFEIPYVRNWLSSQEKFFLSYCSSAT